MTEPILPAFTSPGAKTFATLAVGLIADMATNLEGLKPILPVQFIERADFVVGELHDIAEQMDDTMNLGIYQAVDETRQFPGQGGVK
jgi:hypothetical protein